MEKNTNHNLEQHMLASTKQYAMLLSSLLLSHRIVLEFGMGTGVLTKLILAQQPLKVIGYEIDSALPNTLQYPNLVKECRDIKTINYEHLTPQYCVISNPPYSCLEYIKRFIIDRHTIHDCIIMVP